ncbi:MAG: glutamate racemase [Candidatus Yanofskybacteria bacterium]|nr:glutamate racemase [Candidatus Yanofskybacteria bacterium]
MGTTLNTDKRPIGIFDSGVGGLSVLKELVKLMPKENYIFVADQTNVPYGEKSKKELGRLTLKICDFLVSKNSKIIVVACNTATCNVIDILRAKVKIPLVGTVPAVKPAAISSRSGVIGILSTPSTSKSRGLKKLIETHANNTKVINIGCSDLEDTVETGNLSSPKITQLLSKYTESMRIAGADVVVLGCTHYPFLKPQIKRVLRSNAKLVDSGRAIAKHTKNLLQQMGALFVSRAKTTSRTCVDFYTTGNPSHFSRVASSLLKSPVRAKRISL